MDSPQIVNVVMHDLARPELYGKTVTVVAAYAQRLVDEGRARFERPRAIGFVWPVDAPPIQVAPDLNR